ncbi:MAG: HIT family protein [Lentisphaerota bacterium]
MKTCPFCNLPPERIIAQEGPCIAFFDFFPVSQGHMLIIPKRHVHALADLDTEEWTAIHQLARQLIGTAQKEDPSIRGFNLGINDGAAAGQTIFHTHVHLIPRREGDVQNPRGGVRGVIPCKQHYPAPE